MSTKQIGPIQFQGKLGTIVGRTTRKGYMSLGMKATKVTNPQTQKQVIQRVKFSCAQEYANGIPIECFAGLRPYARSIKASVRNAASKLCFSKNLMSIGNPGDSREINTQINPIDFFFSEGSEPGADFVDVTAETPATVDVATMVNTYKSGILHIIAYQKDIHTFLHVTEAFEKSITPQGNHYTDIQKSVPVPTNWNGMRVEVYTYVQYLPEDISIDYYSQFAAAHSKEREAIESRSTYSPTHYAGNVNVG